MSTTRKRSGLVLDSALDEELAAAYRGWDELEARLGSPRIVDFDLTGGQERETFYDREQVASRLAQLLKHVEVIGGNYGDLFSTRLKASLLLLRALLGERVPFQEYVLGTLGIVPNLIPEADVEDARRSLERLSAGAGTRHGDSSSWSRFEARFTIRRLDLLPRQFEYFREKWLRELERRLATGHFDLNVRVEFARENEYWKNWISSCGGDAVLLRINTHPRHKWYQGSPELLAIHEYCGHAVQMARWRAAIAEGSLPSFCGIVTVHFPDQFILEGLAECLAYFLPSDRASLEPSSRFLLALHSYSLMVLNNLHVLANQDEEAAAVDYAAKRLRFMSSDSIRREVKDRVSNPVFRGYQFVYAPARREFLERLSNVADEQRWRVLRRLYSSPFTVGQWRGMFDK